MKYWELGIEEEWNLIRVIWLDPCKCGKKLDQHLNEEITVSFDETKDVNVH